MKKYVVHCYNNEQYYIYGIYDSEEEANERARMINNRGDLLSDALTEEMGKIYEADVSAVDFHPEKKKIKPFKTLDLVIFIAEILFFATCMVTEFVWTEAHIPFCIVMGLYSLVCLGYYYVHKDE